MYNKKMLNRILLAILIITAILTLISFFTLLIKTEQLSPTLQIILVIPPDLMFLSMSILILLNPEKFDEFLDKINIFRLPSYPKDKEKRIKLHVTISYFEIIFTAIMFLMLIILLLINILKN